MTFFCLDMLNIIAKCCQLPTSFVKDLVLFVNSISEMTIEFRTRSDKTGSVLEIGKN